MKATITVVRYPDQSKQTTGRMDAVKDNEVHLGLKTIERPWLGNQKGVSCIPVGRYAWEKVAPTRAIPYQHIAINNVNYRSGICIHIANYVTNVEGCIGVGLDHKDINKDGLMDVTDSTVAFHRLMDFLPDSGVIEIKNTPAAV